jgi:hypothetical protein
MIPHLPILTCRACGVTDRPILTPGVSRHTFDAHCSRCGQVIKQVPRLRPGPVYKPQGE